MQKDLQDYTSDRFTALATMSHASRAGLHAAGEQNERSSADESPETEREYLATCQKLEQLLERKRRSEDEVDDVGSLHQEICLIGSRLQREPNHSGHEDDYLAVLKRVKETLWRKIEAQELGGEFHKLHFELLSKGHKLGLERPLPQGPAQRAQFDGLAPDAMNLSDLERQIGELQMQIHSLHEHH